MLLIKFSIETLQTFPYFWNIRKSAFIVPKIWQFLYSYLLENFVKGIKILFLKSGRVVFILWIISFTIWEKSVELHDSSHLL